MTHAQDQLIKLIEDEVLPDVEEYIDVLFEKIASKNYLDEDEQNLYDMQEMRDEFKDMLKEVKDGGMEDDECLEIIDEIHDMKALD
ncbi:hypothetical protein A9Q76_08090 [Arcobacter sp. 31_11_sub10_T18]|nr:hypothetical protein A9Q76_08090 [Arcobacter sp. 31_11_sub10_T18]